MSNFYVQSWSTSSPIILHVPHAGLVIPDECLTDFLLSPNALIQEAKLMADLGTKELALRVAEKVPASPSIFINNISRLVFDPERFDDESEEMNSVGMGVLYSKTSSQTDLRTISESREKELKSRFYYPYAQAMEALVEEVLKRHDRAVIIDLHSYSKEPLLYELHKNQQRPEICIGVDGFHSPNHELTLITRSFERVGSVAINQPFSGSYVPLKHYGKNNSVISFMLEIRKDVFEIKRERLEQALLSVITNI